MTEDITTEDGATNSLKDIHQQFGVRSSSILTTDEYTTELSELGYSKPEWFDSHTNRYVLKITLYGYPEPPMIKATHDLLNDINNSQVHYIEPEEVYYICPTTNDFSQLDIL